MVTYRFVTYKGNFIIESNSQADAYRQLLDFHPELRNHMNFYLEDKDKFISHNVLLAFYQVADEGGLIFIRDQDLPKILTHQLYIELEAVLNT